MSYPESPGFKEETTSRDAAENIQHRARALRKAVAAIYAGGSQCTPDEVAVILHESVLAIRPRITELYKQGRIRRTGERRKNKSGQFAHVMAWQND